MSSTVRFLYVWEEKPLFTKWYIDAVCVCTSRVCIVLNCCSSTCKKSSQVPSFHGTAGANDTLDQRFGSSLKQLSWFGPVYWTVARPQYTYLILHPCNGDQCLNDRLSHIVMRVCKRICITWHTLCVVGDSIGPR